MVHIQVRKATFQAVTHPIVENQSLRAEIKFHYLDKSCQLRTDRDYHTSQTSLKMKRPSSRR